MAAIFLSSSWHWGLLSLRKKKQIIRVKQRFLLAQEEDQIRPLDPKRPRFKSSSPTSWCYNFEQILSPESFLLVPLICI